MQEWVRREGQRVVVVFEGRDAAGKGSTIQRVAQYLNPRGRDRRAPGPTERQRAQWYFQRYVEHLPAQVRSSVRPQRYNRAGIEQVMGLHARGAPAVPAQCPIFERMLVEDGIRLHKYWFSVSDTEQQRRFESRLDHAPVEALPDRPRVDHPLGGLLPGQGRDARAHRHQRGRWNVVESDDKRRSRINMIAHLLSQVPTRRSSNRTSSCPSGRPPGLRPHVAHPRHEVPDHAATLKV